MPKSEDVLDEKADEAHRPIRSFGRTRTRTIKPKQAGLIDTLLPSIALDPSAPIDPAMLMPGATEVWLEIGFGGGEHMAALAARRPDVVIVGAEPFWNGAASALRHIDEAGLKNVRLLVGDARELMAALPDASLDRVYIMFPDPWPKARHHKRRLIQAETVAELARVMKPPSEGKSGAHLRFASDWADYVDWTLERFDASPNFRWLAERADDWRTPPPDRITTRYEEKKLGDIAPIWLDFEKV